MSRVNTHYCRPSADALSIEYAPVIFPPSPHEPTEADYLAHGWYRNETHNPPTPPEGKSVSSKRYAITEDGVRVVAVYEYADIPPRVSIFSKLRLYAALAQAGLWDALKIWLEGQTIDGVNAYTAFSLAQELTDAHPLFTQWYAAAKVALGVDDETAEAILEASEVNG